MLSGFAIAYLIYRFTDLSSSVVVGILSGAVTNTPSLGAAHSVLAEQGASTAETGMAYAMAYPFGVIGIILTMLLVRLFFRISVDKEVKEYGSTLGGGDTQLQNVEITVTNPNLIGRDIDHIIHIMDSELAVSRIRRKNGREVVASGPEVLQEGDILYGVSSQKLINNLEMKIGNVRVLDKVDVGGPLAAINVMVTKRNITGKTIEQVGIYRRYPANITRVYRNGLMILPTLHTTLELGDTVKIVGQKDVLDDVRKELGDSLRELAKPNISSIFLGIFLGIILGSVPIFLPGLPAPAKLGLAGGPLLVAILLGYKGRVGRMNFYMSPGGEPLHARIGHHPLPVVRGLALGRAIRGNHRQRRGALDALRCNHHLCAHYVGRRHRAAAQTQLSEDMRLHCRVDDRPSGTGICQQHRPPCRHSPPPMPRYTPSPCSCGCCWRRYLSSSRYRFWYAKTERRGGLYPRKTVRFSVITY